MDYKHPLWQMIVGIAVVLVAARVRERIQKHRGRLRRKRSQDRI
jgi:hypothetical protein